MTEKKSILSKILVGLLVIGGLAGAFWYYKRAHVSDGIAQYEPVRDRDFIIATFKKDWYWLVADFNQEFSPEKVLDTRVSSHGPEYPLHIRVFLINNKPVGFVTYLNKELYEGFIQHLGVDREYRSRHIGRQLITYALSELKKQGARVARLITRVDNAAARKLYTTLGFKEIWTDGAYIKYEKDLMAS